jgi:hypothetical protein
MTALQVNVHLFLREIFNYVRFFRVEIARKSKSTKIITLTTDPIDKFGEL